MIGLPWDDGEMYTYATQQMVKMIWNLAVVEFIILGVLGLLFLFRSYVNRKPSKGSAQDEESLISASQLSNSGYQPESAAKGFDVFYFSTSVLFYAIIVMFAVIIGVLHGFQKMGSTAGKKALTASMIVLVGVLFHVLWKFLHSPNKNRQFFKDLTKLTGNDLVFIFVGLILWITFVGLIMFFLNGICYCIYNDNLGSISTSTGISTTLTRRLVLEKRVCPDNSICRVYATLPSSTNTSVFINVHTALNVEELFIVMTDIKKNTTVQEADVYMFETDFDEEYGKRKVWTFLFNDLTPSTLYNVTLFNQQLTEFQTTYKTLPSYDQKIDNLRVIIGGDIGLTEHGRILFRNMGELQPDLMIFGGDIAYDNAMTYCYTPWDNFYSLIDKVNAHGRLVPFILALGNHDIGWNSYARIKAQKPSEKGPWYFAYNPQHFAPGTNDRIPRIEDRIPHGYHIIGKNVIITLDSQYVSTYESQSVFLQETAKGFRNLNYSLFALYHVPLYPSCFHQSHFQSKEALDQSHEFYEPVFIKYNFTLCFQNHVHKLKRTKPINGVVYIGDGNLGVDQVGCTEENQIYKDHMAMDMFEGSNHYWVSDWNQSHIKLQAFAVNHTVVDSSFVQIR